MPYPTDGELTYGTSLNMLQMVFALQRAHTGRMLISTLANDLEVHERTIKRYIKALEDTLTDEDGNPLIERKLIGNRAHAVVRRSIITQSSVFNYAAVHVAAQNISAIREPLLSGFADEVKEDLRTHALETKPNLRTQFERIEEVFAYVPFGPKDYERKEDELDLLIRAALDRNACRIRYASASSDEREIEVRPLCLLLYRDGLYLRAQAKTDTKTWELRTYSLDRIQAVEKLKETFRRPIDFDPRKVGAGRLGIWQDDAEEVEELTLRFEPDAALRARERRWPGQANEWQIADDGRHEIRLRLAVTPELVTWLLTWGGKVEVIEPESLRDAVRQAFAEGLELYI